MEVPDRVREHASGLDRLPAYVYDLVGLREHVAAVRKALDGVELFYAAKANADAPILRALAPYVDGVEVSSGGELRHVRESLPDARLAFGGPGKTDEELALALELGVERIHVESPYELARLDRIATGLHRRRAAQSGPAGSVDVLLRANLPIRVRGAALKMSGPFGMDAKDLATCARMLRDTPHIRLRGMHAHLASGLGAEAMLEVASQIAEWALPWLREHAPDLDTPELNLGGGMAVDYEEPEELFDWKAYGSGLAGAGFLRVEPGRSMTAYHGWYVTEVLDVKTTRGDAYAILRGGTHHLRTPVTKGHDQPFAVIPRATSGPSLTSASATLVGQLCTPKDVFARNAAVKELRPGDRVAFGMAGAYAWNISHHDFLMHPKPAFHYLE
jgi:diaminopimelate decarboxylase